MVLDFPATPEQQEKLEEAEYQLQVVANSGPVQEITDAEKLARVAEEYHRNLAFREESAKIDSEWIKIRKSLNSSLRSKKGKKQKSRTSEISRKKPSKA